MVEQVNRKFTSVGQQKLSLAKKKIKLKVVMDVVLDEFDKEMTKVKKLVKEVNEGLLLVCRCGDVVLDKEADVEVNQEGDKEVANVVNEFSHVGTV